MDQQESMTDDRPAIARAVAKALQLVGDGHPTVWYDTGLDRNGYRIMLHKDGSDLFREYWIWRCIEWLLKQGWSIWISSRSDRHEYSNDDLIEQGGGNGIRYIECPATEFPARAVAALMKGAEDE